MNIELQNLDISKIDDKISKEAKQLVKEFSPVVKDAVPTLIDISFNVIAAFTILFIGWWFAKWSYYSVRRLLAKTRKIDATLKPIIASLVRYIIMIFVAIAVLAKFGIETASIITVLGAAGLAIGLSLQGTLSNIAAGVMLLFLRPLKVGEYIDAQGHAGTVEEIGLFTTILCTFDGVYYSVPNAELWNKAIKNFSRNPTRRVDIPVGIAYKDNTEGAMKELLEIMEKDKRVLKEPKAETMVLSLSDNAVIINMRCWVASSDYWAAFFDFNRLAKITMDEKGYSIPFPQRDVYVYNMDKK